MTSHEKMLEIKKVTDKWWGGLAGLSARDALLAIRNVLDKDD